MNRKLLYIPLFAVVTLLAGFQQSIISAAQEKAVQQAAIPNLKVNINKASAEELADVLTGVGLSKAKSIVEYRKANGAFKKVDELLKIKGIGPATLAKNRDRLIL